MKVSIHAGWALASGVMIAFCLFSILAACTPMGSLAALAWSKDHFMPFAGTRLPEWFKEGPAEMVSGGATSSSVAVSEALKAIGEGRVPLGESLQRAKALFDVDDCEHCIRVQSESAV